jgi:DnaA family protein
MNRQLALAIQLNDEATLEDFCWDNNCLLKQEIIAFLNNDSEERFLTLWGISGSGKSHLLQACCQALTNCKSSIYLPLRVLKKWGPQSIAGVERHHLITLDDINLIAGDSDWEEAIFHLYNKARAQDDTRLIISTNQPPALTQIKLADLHSRLSWGLVIQLQDLNDQLKIQTLQQHAKKRGFELPRSVGEFLISRCARNMHDLHSILDQLDSASLAAQRKITIPFVKTILSI